MRNNLLVILCLMVMLAVCLIPSASAEPPEWVLSGQCTYAGGAVAGNIQVAIRNDDTGDLLYTTTNSNGVYSKDLTEMLNVISDGDEITITAFGTTPAHKTFTLDFGTNPFGDVVNIQISGIGQEDEQEKGLLQSVWDWITGAGTDEGLSFTAMVGIAFIVLLIAVLFLRR